MFLTTCAIRRPCVQSLVLLLKTRSPESLLTRAPAEKHPSLSTLSRQPLAPNKDPPDDFDELKSLNDNVFGHKHCLLSLGLPPLPPPVLVDSVLVPYACSVTYQVPPRSLCPGPLLVQCQTSGSLFPVPSHLQDKSEGSLRSRTLLLLLLAVPTLFRQVSVVRDCLATRDGWHLKVLRRCADLNAV